MIFIYRDNLVPLFTKILLRSFLCISLFFCFGCAKDKEKISSGILMSNTSFSDKESAPSRGEFFENEISHQSLATAGTEYCTPNALKPDFKLSVLTNAPLSIKNRDYNFLFQVVSQNKNYLFPIYSLIPKLPEHPDNKFKQFNLVTFYPENILEKNILGLTKKQAQNIRATYPKKWIELIDSVIGCVNAGSARKNQQTNEEYIECDAKSAANLFLKLKESLPRNNFKKTTQPQGFLELMELGIPIENTGSIGLGNNEVFKQLNIGFVQCFTTQSPTHCSVVFF